MAEIVLMVPRIGYTDDLRSSPSLPLGVLHASSFAAKEFDVAIVDLRVEPDWRRKLREVIGSETLLVGCSVFTGPMILSALQMAEEARKLTDVPLVWGGIHPSVEPDSALSDPLCDIVVIGEGELTLLELARALKKKTPLDNIAGLAFKRNGETVKTPPRDLLNLEDLPEIPYELLDVPKYLPLFLGRRSLNIQSSRGCPNACKYCYNPRYNRNRWRGQSAEKTLARIAHVVEKYRVEDIYLVDDNILVDVERDKKIIEGMRELGITWQIQGIDVVAFNKMDDVWLKKLKESGISRLSIGVESGSPRIRKLMGKAGTVDDIREAFRKMAKYDVVVYGSFMSGLPTETFEDTKMTVDLIFELLRIHPRACTSPVYVYTPYPGTRMYETAIEMGFKPPDSLQKWGESGSWADSTWDGGNPATKKFYESLYFVSNFFDHKARIYDASMPMKILSEAYRPFARWRAKHFRFEFLIGKMMADWLKWNIPQRKSSRDVYSSPIVFDNNSFSRK